VYRVQKEEALSRIVELVQAVDIYEVPTPQPNIRKKRAQYFGEPMDFRGLRHEPVNEQGVVFLFGMLANDLGFLIEGIQEGFPDCVGKRRIAKNKWAQVRIEFEYTSRNFLLHGHDVQGCDLVVCWYHDWHDCPLEVLELSKEITRYGT